MYFYKIFLVLSILVAAIITHSEAGFLKKIGKKIEGVGKRTLGATSKTLVVAQQAADVAATASKG